MMVWIDASTLFGLAGQLFLLAWLLLVLSLWLPRLQPAVDALGTWLLPVLVGLVYVALMLSQMPFAEGGFGSLAEVRLLFANDRLLLAGWLHFLVFDFFIGCWIARRSRELPLWRALLLPCLALCFLAGPAGLLAWWLLRAGDALRRRCSGHPA